MKRFYFGIVLDSLTFCFIYFILSLILLYYFISGIPLIVISIMLALLLSLLTFAVIFKKRKKFYEEEKTKKLSQAFMLKLNLLKKDQITKLFTRALEKEYGVVSKKKNAIYIEDIKTYVFLIFGYKDLTKSQVVKIYNMLGKSEKAFIYLDEIDKNMLEFCARFKKIKVYSAIESYKLVGKNDPALSVDLPKSRAPLFNLLDKKRAKSYLGFGVFFLASSFFAPIKIYYIICGAVMFIFALVVLLYGRTDLTES